MLTPPLSLGKHQAYLKEQLKAKDDKPTFFVFHGGSGSAASEFQEAISHGVVKVNLDTDLQWAYLCGVRDYVTKNIEYLNTQVGNPEGADKPNKKKYDPRVWVSSSNLSYHNARSERGILTRSTDPRG